MSDVVENVAEDGVEPKPGKNKASGVGVGSGVASDHVKPTNDVKFKVKIPFQAHIIHNQAKLVPIVNFEEKPKPVPTGVRVIEVNTRSFFYKKEFCAKLLKMTKLFEYL